MQLEICCGDIVSLLAAKEGGAERIELCSALSEGGLTPSIGLIKRAVNSGISRVNVLIRPRTGDFLYTDPEIDLMDENIKCALDAGANGIVIGALTPDGEIDTETCSRLIATAHKYGNNNLNITFHRAFDMSHDWRKSLHSVIDLGCDCLLTSGMATNAMRGVPLLSSLVNEANGKILIMAGAGINPANAADIIAATGVGAIHSTARKPVPSKMVFRRASVSMGVKGADEYAQLVTSADVVKALKGIVSQS